MYIFESHYYRLMIHTQNPPPPPRRSKLLRSLLVDACKPKKTLKKRYNNWGKNYFSGEGGG